MPGNNPGFVCSCFSLYRISKAIYIVHGWRATPPFGSRTLHFRSKMSIWVLTIFTFLYGFSSFKTKFNVNSGDTTVNEILTYLILVYCVIIMKCWEVYLLPRTTKKSSIIKYAIPKIHSVSIFCINANLWYVNLNYR
jgi:hypothetical protein